MPSQRVTVDLSFYVVALNGRFILYSEEVLVEQEHSPNPQKNDFAVMMMAAKELKLPPKVFSTPERYEVGRSYVQNLVIFYCWWTFHVGILQCS